MISFKQAVRRHSFFREVADPDLATAEQAWSGVTGKPSAGGPTILVDAIADTTPIEYATLLAIEDIPAAFASAEMLGARDRWIASNGHEPATPREARLVAHAGWAEFRKIADQGGWIEHGLGADMSGSWPVARAIQKKEVDAAKVRRISDLAGRMFKALKGARAKRVEDIPEEVVGVTTGPDFPALLPSEYAMLATDPTRKELFRRLFARETQQFERAGRDKKARGPMVIALDESGSMSGDREIWSKAAMTALTRLAWEDKRPVVVTHFSTATKAVRLNPGDYLGLVKAQDYFLDGGTDIGTALEVSLDEVQALERAGVKGADVVLVSDGGDAGYRIDSAIAAMEKQNVRLWSVAIECEFFGALRERAAEYIHLTDDDMHDPKSAVGLAGSVTP